jgi:hypothetical protein
MFAGNAKVTRCLLLCSLALALIDTCGRWEGRHDGKLLRHCDQRSSRRLRYRSNGLAALPISPCGIANAIHERAPRQMDDADIMRIVDAFGAAAARAKAAGFDEYIFIRATVICCRSSIRRRLTVAMTSVAVLVHAFLAGVANRIEKRAGLRSPRSIVALRLARKNEPRAVQHSRGFLGLMPQLVGLL